MAPPIRRIHVPMSRVEDVIPHLGRPSHFRDGYSAKLLAQSWFVANDLPPTIRSVLDQSPRFSTVSLIEAFLERRLSLGDASTPSQADVLAVLGLADGLAIMAVEGKVRESFGPRVSEWIANGSDAKQARLRRIAETLGLDVTAAQPLRWQLLHRSASAIYEAKRYRSRVAVMMVQSFDPNETGIADFRCFAAAIGLSSEGTASLTGPIRCEGVELYLGWAAARSV